MTTENQAIINRQLGQSSRTADTYYTLDRTNKDAAEVFKLLATATAGTRGAAAEEADRENRLYRGGWKKVGITCEQIN